MKKQRIFTILAVLFAIAFMNELIILTPDDLCNRVLVINTAICVLVFSVLANLTPNK